MTAEEWYREFYKLSNNDPRLDKNCSDAEWTRRMNAFLKDMAYSQSFKIDEPECKVFGDKRIDHVWRRGNTEIAIEHENDYTSIDNEVKKLCERSSNLKVLITYVQDEDFVANACSLSVKVRDLINALGNRHGEFLIVVGGWGRDGWITDWAAYRSIVDLQIMRGKLTRQGKPA
ncbi:MAG: hypothetical protein NW701_14440 [Nitrospira sp.]